MSRLSGGIAAFALALLALAPAAQAQARVEVGVLTCRAEGARGFIVTSSKHLHCTFRRRGRDEYYHGDISKFGIDIGSTRATRIAWAVLAPTANLPPRSLVGDYGGVSAEATIGVGVGANALVGGSNNTVALQPLSVQGQTGLSAALGVAGLELRPGY